MSQTYEAKDMLKLYTEHALTYQKLSDAEAILRSTVDDGYATEAITPQEGQAMSNMIHDLGVMIRMHEEVCNSVASALGIKVE